MSNSEKYIRVATTLYKIVSKPLHSGDSVLVRLPWSFEVLRQDYTKDSMPLVEKYDGFCCVPSHVQYQRSIRSFLNEYEPIEYVPQQGRMDNIEAFLRHIFGDMYELGLDYLQLLYTRPLQRLPILLLVSQERNTGKTTFLNLLKLIFGRNMTFNTNEDFRSQFNSDWANKLIVAVDEVLLDRKEDSERIKNLSTARSYKAEAKGKDRQEVEFFAKFILCSNNEDRPVHIDPGETRYWVLKINSIERDNTNLLAQMESEIPALLWFLQSRDISTKQSSRMWFDPKLLKSNAFYRIVDGNRSEIEEELCSVIRDLFAMRDGKPLYFSNEDMRSSLVSRGHSVTLREVRSILQIKLKIKPVENSVYVECSRLAEDGTIVNEKRNARCYVVTSIEYDNYL